MVRSNSAKQPPLHVQLGDGTESGVDTAERLLPPEQRDRLEDARGDRGAGERDAQRLVDVARFDAAASMIPRSAASR